ncbi:MAG: hypothetical protein BKP49_05990 [Treponema sp. CETP13]|nr:MAG: hypothetical protein BKP49_05990 [Treponema sp. CETP13]
MLKCKRLLIFVIVAVLIVPTHVFASKTQTEGYLYAEIQSELVSKAYPAVLATSKIFIEKYSQSVYLDDIQLCYGEALFFTGSATKARDVLLKSEKSQDPKIQSASQYWLGRIAFAKNDFNTAVKYFYLALDVLQDSNNMLLKKSSWFYTGKSLYELNDFEQVEKVLRYYLATFPPDDNYQEISRLLCATYFKSEEYENLIDFYNAIPLESFSKDSQEICKIYAAGAYAAIEKYQDAYALYTEILSSSNKQRSLAALQRAYSIVNKNDVESEQELLDLATSYLGNESDTLQNLWVRSGITTFQEGDFDTALQYFERSEKIGATTGELWDLCTLYQAKIYAYQNDASKALAFLQERYNDASSFAPWFLTAQAALSAQIGDWLTCEAQATDAIKKLETSSLNNKALYDEALYWRGGALYAQSKIPDAVTTLSKASNSETGGATTFLYAQALFSAGNRKKALELFTTFFPNNKDTAIAQLKTGDYLSSWKTAINADDQYISGLDAYCFSDWERASYAFQQALLKEKVPTNKLSWANYYYADSLYHQGEYAKSLERFELFLKSWATHIKAWDAKMNVAKCAIQIGGDKMGNVAMTSVAEASTIATTNEQKIESAILAASLYTDAHRYGDAEQVLLPLAKSYSPDSVPVRFQLANIYAAEGKLNAADAELEKISEVFKTSDFAREAAYRRGEIFYRAGEYEVAAQKFADFRQNWQSGNFSDAALFFGAESLAKSGSTGRAILLYNDEIERYPNGTYTFASMSALIKLYRENEEYQEALHMANRMLEEFDDQARNAGVVAEVSELQLLVNGGDEQSAQLYATWTKNKKNQTSTGREAGFNLAIKYISMPEKKAEGIQMLKSLAASLESLGAADTVESSLSTQQKADINLYARVLEEQAKLERDTGSAINAANIYMKVAERYSVTEYVDSREKAARAMYGAVEAFDIGRKYADSRAVYNTMQDSFADSEWTAKAKKIIE